MSAPGVRARVRAELTREIAEVARQHLASDGAAGLSLRAVARELGMASSAVYRYFPSRDDLLTALIVDAYDALGEAAETADSLGLAFARAATPGRHPAFVSMITELVRERLALPDDAVPGQDCPADCCRYVAAVGRPGGGSRA